MKYENIITWLLLGYIAWEIGQRTSGAFPVCGGTTTVPQSSISNVLQAAQQGQVTAGGLGCYSCGQQGVFGG